jgi:alcohol dehydrogenase YqhD (iron-dependent ADH family)
MNNFNYRRITRFVFGKETETAVGRLVKKEGGTKVLIVYGGGSAIRSGLIDRVKESLDNEEIHYCEIMGVKPNPSDDLVYEGISICKEEGADFLLGVGGGSVIDTAKAIAIGSLYEGDFWDFYGRKKKVEKALPVGTICTIAAAGSEGSGSSVITQEETKLKRSSKSEKIVPIFSILNPELTITLPEYQTSCGITDMLAHVMERYFTNTKDVELTDRLCEGTMKAIINQAYKLIENPENYEARANIMWAGVVAHNNSIGMDREQDWSSHKIEHELSGMFDIAHGAGLAIVFPAWMKYVMNHDISRFVQFAHRVWDVDVDYNDLAMTALKGISQYEKFMKDIGMPIRLNELDITEDDIDKLVKQLGLKDGETTGSFVKLNKEDIKNIYKLAL